MPTYEYECEACGHKFDHFQSMTSRRLRKCPSCSKPKLKRLIGGGAGVIFKGSGFYETDYKSKRSRRGGGPGSRKDVDAPCEDAAAACPAETSSGSSESAGEARPCAGGSCPVD